MTPLEHERLWSFIRRDNIPICATCRHFQQHYIYMDDLNRYERLHQGHCTRCRIKPRKPYDLCNYYSRKE